MVVCKDFMKTVVFDLGLKEQGVLRWANSKKVAFQASK